MKFIKFTIFCWLLVFFYKPPTLAQPYESVFGKDTTLWNVSHIYAEYTRMVLFQAYGDTVIDGQDYIPVYENNYYAPLELYGYFKEDTIVGKLWFRDKEGMERLIMDLTLAKGDSFYFGRGDFWVPFLVDSVYKEAGKKVIAFEPNDAYRPILFIEGLGPFNFFYYQAMDDPFFTEIVCKKEDGMVTFMNKNYKNCFNPVNGISNFNKRKILIYPNSSRDYIYVSNDQTEAVNIDLYDGSGNRVLSERVKGDGQIDIGELPCGIYVVALHSGTYSFSQKIIVN